MREIRTSGSTRGQWLAGQPSPTVLLYRPFSLSSSVSYGCSNGTTAHGFRRSGKSFDQVQDRPFFR